MKKRINWKEVQSFYDTNKCTLKELSKRFDIVSYSSFWKAKRRGDFTPLSISDAMLLSVKRGRRNKSISDKTKLKISSTVNEKIKNGEWHASLAKRLHKTYKGINFHGTWEVEYAKWLDKNSINWRRPTETFKYTFEGKDRRYTPDFYLTDESIYVEIKGYETEKDRSKWKQFPLPLNILKYEDLKKIGVSIKSR